MADYLTIVTEKKLRKTLTRYSLSEHSLAVETGRHRQSWKPREDRLCPLCSQAEVETELHFLLDCPNYSEIRELYLPKLKKNRHKFCKPPTK